MYYVFSAFVGCLASISIFLLMMKSLVPLPSILIIPLIPLLFVFGARLIARWFPFETKEANMSLKKYSIYQFGVTLPFYNIVSYFLFILQDVDVFSKKFEAIMLYYILIGCSQWCVMTARFVKYSTENPTNRIVIYLIPTLAYCVNIFYAYIGGGNFLAPLLAFPS